MSTDHMPREDRRRTIFILNRFFFPDHSATAQIASDLGFHLATQGFAVVGVCARLRYEGDSDDLSARETANGVTICRMPTTRFGRGAMAGRMADYLTFYVTAFFYLLVKVRRHDVIICKTDPPLLSVAAAIICALRGAALVNWLQDLFPEVAEAVGTGWRPRALFGALRWLRNWSLGRARANVSIGEAMRDRLRRARINAERLHVIPNWGDQHIEPVSVADNDLRRAWGIAPDSTIVAYSGNIGQAHDATTIVAAAAMLGADTPVRFLMIGDGAKMGAMQADIARRDIADRFMFRPYQPRAQLSQSLSCGDIHWLSLDPALEGMIVPSKIYGILSAARPFVFIGAADGEVAQIIDQHGGGFVIAPGDGAGLTQLLTRLAGDADLQRQLGEQSLAAAACFTRDSGLDQWTRLVRSITA